MWREIGQFFSDLKARSPHGGEVACLILAITVESAEVVPFAAAPALAFKLRVANADPAETIHTVVLRCQIQIEVTRRRYTAGGAGSGCAICSATPERWGQTLRSLLCGPTPAPWCRSSRATPRSICRCPARFDFSVATTKYFNGLSDGEIPVLLMFSGTVFYADGEGSLRVAPISWDKETKFRLPLKVWKEMMDAYYPNSAWLCLRRDVFEELHRFKVEHGIPTWEQAFERHAGRPIEEAVRRMNIEKVEKIADAVLYEGYMLYPYGRQR